MSPTPCNKEDWWKKKGQKWWFFLFSISINAFFSLDIQCPWLPDICLVQCARGNRANSTNCIIFEINKFLIGLELVQERQLHLETNVLKVEDDTNCSLSSIEEDFLTASEHLEEESEVEDLRNGENCPIKQMCILKLVTLWKWVRFQPRPFGWCIRIFTYRVSSEATDSCA